MHSSLWISFYGFALFDWNWWFWSCSLEVLLFSSLSFCGFVILDWNLWFDLAPEKARTDTVFRLLLYICVHSSLNFFSWVCNTWLKLVILILLPRSTTTFTLFFVCLCIQCSLNFLFGFSLFDWNWWFWSYSREVLLIYYIYTSFVCLCIPFSVFFMGVPYLIEIADFDLTPKNLKKGWLVSLAF